MTNQRLLEVRSSLSFESSAIGWLWRLLLLATAMILLTAPARSDAQICFECLSPPEPTWVVFNAPAANAQLAGGTQNVTISVTGGGTGETNALQLWHNSTLLASTNGAPLTFVWTNRSPGTYTVRAVAIANNCGCPSVSEEQSLTFTVLAPNAAPNVALTSPGAGTLPGPTAAIFLQANASDTDGTVARVEFFANGALVNTDTVAPFEFAWSGVGAGSYTVFARAVDNLGAPRDSAAVTVRVNAPPTGSMSAAGGAGVIPGPSASALLQAAASDSDGSINRVEFWSGGTLLATTTAAPYQWTWSGLAPSSYTVFARIFDNDLQSRDTAAVSFRVNALPTIGFSSPAAGAVLPGPVGNTTVTASPADTDGSIERVEFWQGGTLLSTDFTAPYTHAWSSLGVGNHTILARARDNDGQTRDATLTVRVNNPPSGSISSPAANAVIPRSVAAATLQASASDTDGAIARVEFWNGSTLLATDTTAPYSWTWASLASGSYSFFARIVDNDNQSRDTSPVSFRVNTLPTVSITAPLNNAVVPGPTANIVIQANAADSEAGGSVARVEFLVNGQLVATDTTAPYAHTWSGAGVGNHTILARVWDNTNESVDASISVRVNDPPTVALTGPRSGILLAAPAAVTLSATATDSDNINRVEFVANGSVIGTDTTAPYSFNWSSVAAGTYTVVARAFDGLLASRDSAPITVEVAGATTIVPPGASGGAIAGTLPGTVTVDPSGAATYAIPLSLPPGTAGVAPGLSFGYSSRGGDGLMGHGWSLSGFSAITRCGRTRATDGSSNAPKTRVNLDQNDQFCLDGQRLVLVSGTLGGTAEFRTELDSFSRITSTGSNPAKGPDTWTVRAKDGMVITFGATADSTLEAQGRTPTVVLSWMANRVEDRRGNFYTIEYQKNVATGESYPVRMRYTGNAAAAITPYHKVEFVYTNPRTDVYEGYVAGSIVGIRRRLDQVQVFVDTAADGSGGTLVRRYAVSYTSNTTNGRALVQSIQDCADTGTTNCLPATVFSYQQRNASHNNFNGPGSGLWTGAFTELPGNYQNTLIVAGQIGEIQSWVRSKSVFADFDGDGRTDHGYSNGGGQWNICRSTSSGYSCSQWAAPGASDRVLAADFNGDGRMDIAVPPTIAGLGAPVAGTLNVCLSTGTGFTCSAWSGMVGGDTAQDGGISRSYTLADLNADGRTDYILANGTAPNLGIICESTGSSFSCTGSIPIPWDHIRIEPDALTGAPLNQFVQGDFNGDGADDWMAIPYNSPDGRFRLCSRLETGFTCADAGASATAPVQMSPRQPGATFAANINHDGVDAYTDFLTPRSAGTAATNGDICRGSGTAMVCTSRSGGNNADLQFNTIGDVDGDGRPDSLGFDGIRRVWRVCQISNAASPTCEDWSGPDVTINMATNNTGRLADWRFGDFNGDGRIDIATYDRVIDSWTMHLANGPVPDVLVSVTDGVGHQTQIVYGNLQDASVYTRDTTATYPQRNVQDGSLVVRELRTDNAVGGWVSTTYRYGGAKIDQAGRGFLGFRWFEATDSVSTVVTRTEVSQNFPTLGMPMLITATHSNGREIRRVENRVVSSITANPAPSTNPRVHFPFIDRSVETSRELNDATQATVTQVTADPIAYDLFGNERRRLTTTVAGGQTFTEDATTTYLNNTTTWIIGRPESVTVLRTAPGVSNVTRTTTMTYTAQGEPEVVTIEPGGTADLRLQTTNVRHPTIGVVTSQTVAWTETNTSTSGWTEDGTARTRTVQSMTYDSRFRYPATIRNALNHEETRQYDQRTGQLTLLRGPNLIDTTWQYDHWGRRTRATRADGTYTTTRYTQCVTNCGTARVLVTSQVFNSSNAQISVPGVRYLDRLGREVRWQGWTFDGRERVAERSYDSKGRLASRARTRFATGEVAQNSTYIYDDLGRVTETNDPGVGPSRIAYNGLTTTFTNPRNQTRVEVRNGLGTLRTVTDARSKTTTYLYDPFANLLRVTDPAGNEVRITVDRLGRRTQLRDPNLGTWNYVINALGETRSQTDAKAQTIKFRYDTLGRMQQRLAPDLNSFWTYDSGNKAIGKLSEAYTLTGTGTKDYQRLHAYDNLGRPARTTVSLDIDYVTESTYDSNGRVSRGTWIRRAKGATTGGQPIDVDYAYNSFGYLAQMRLATGAQAGTLLWTVNQQDALDRVLRQSAGNGVVTERVFRADNARLEVLRAGPLASGSVNATVQNDTYTYDALGNLTLRGQLNASGGILQENFGYDELNRLTSSQVVGQTAQTVTYNDFGNIVTKSDVGTYTYPASGANSVRPHAVASITGTVAGVANPTFSYDANGNLLSGVGRTASWSSFNMPLTLAKTGTAGSGSAGTSTATHAFVYGPEYQRVRQTITVASGPNAGTTTHWYAGGFERETRTADNTTQVRVFLPQGVVLTDRYTSATANVTTAATTRQLRYYQRDRLGSTTAVTDEAGSVLERQFYDPWGQRRNGDGSASLTLQSRDHRYGYTEHEMLDAIGLVHMNGRIYDPLLARFMSADPTIPDPTDGQNYNRYSYVLNSPTNYTDPSGFAQVRQVESIGNWGSGFGGDNPMRRPAPDPEDWPGLREIPTFGCVLGFNCKHGDLPSNDPRQPRSRPDLSGGSEGESESDSGGDGGGFRWEETDVSRCAGCKPLEPGETPMRNLRLIFTKDLLDLHSAEKRSGLFGSGGRDQIVQGVVDLASLVPYLGAGVTITQGILAGNLGTVTLGVASLAADVFAPGAGSMIRGAAAGGKIAARGLAASSKQAADLSKHLGYAEKYGKGGVKELQNGRTRYYGEVQPASKAGEMAGRRYVHEFNPATGRSRGWHETVDHSGNVRQVRPELNNGTKTHYTFDSAGRYTGNW